MNGRVDTILSKNDCHTHTLMSKNLVLSTDTYYSRMAHGTLSSLSCGSTMVRYNHRTMGSIQKDRGQFLATFKSHQAAISRSN